MKTTFLLLLLLAASFSAYKFGRSRGFDQGWEKGYVRGVLQYDNELEIDRVEKEIRS